jgi:hypothetical protein
MRQMPSSGQSHMNPNDGMVGGYGQKKRQYTNVNQHYISHNAVIPPYHLSDAMASIERK